MDLAGLEKVSATEWRIEPTGAMRVPAIPYADETLIREMDEKVREQAVNVATPPSIVRAAYAMPDAHWGYGFPISAALRRLTPRQAASASTSPAACARI